MSIKQKQEHQMLVRRLKVRKHQLKMHMKLKIAQKNHSEHYNESHKEIHNKLLQRKKLENNKDLYS